MPQLSHMAIPFYSLSTAHRIAPVASITKLVTPGFAVGAGVGVSTGTGVPVGVTVGIAILPIR